MSVATVVAGHTQGLSGAARCSPTSVAPLDPTRAWRGCRSCGSAATANIWRSVPERDTWHDAPLCRTVMGDPHPEQRPGRAGVLLLHRPLAPGAGVRAAGRPGPAPAPDHRDEC